MRPIGKLRLSALNSQLLFYISLKSMQSYLPLKMILKEVLVEDKNYNLPRVKTKLQETAINKNSQVRTHN